MHTVIFDLDSHPLYPSLLKELSAIAGDFSRRQFPDGESYLRILTDVNNTHCVLLVDWVNPDAKFLPVVFMAETLRELGALSVGLVVPYLPYMRQDIRFQSGEVVTSRIFAKAVSNTVDWLVTVDPHLHRYHSLDEIYSIPTCVLQGSPLLAQWLKSQSQILLVGPDAESEQWVASIASVCGHPFVIGSKDRNGDRQVRVQLPDLAAYSDYTAVIIDDVISSGRTILDCMRALQENGIRNIACAAVHGIFADDSDQMLLNNGLAKLITSNSIAHRSNQVDLSSLIVAAVADFLRLMERP